MGTYDPLIGVKKPWLLSTYNHSPPEEGFESSALWRETRRKSRVGMANKNRGVQKLRETVEQGKKGPKRLFRGFVGDETFPNYVGIIS